MTTAITNTNWDAELYNNKHDFVFKYGEDLVRLLNPQPGERILDLGCGTGFLTDLIASSGAMVQGIDSSAEMIIKAKSHYPELNFRVMPGESFHFDERFDAIFSNATLHWILEKEKVIDCMYTNLRHSGRAVLEMGGKHNVEKIIAALKSSLIKHGYEARSKNDCWYFPSLSEYTTLLEKRGFKVSYAAYFNRETLLKDASAGITEWIKMFGKSYLAGIDETSVAIILNEVQDTLRPTHFRDGSWYADYKRLRIIAIR